MKRRGRILLNVLTLLSLALLILSTILWDVSWGETTEGEFRCGAMWHAALEPGVIHLDNKPQRNLEAKKIAEERTPLTESLNREPYGSPEYRKALAESRIFDAQADRRMAAIPKVDRSISISMLLACFGLLPAIGCGRWLFRLRREFARQLRGRFAVVIVIWFVLCVMIIIYWARSNVPLYDELIYNNTISAERHTSFFALRSIRGTVVLIGTRRSWDDQQEFEMTTVEVGQQTPNGVTLHSSPYPAIPSKLPFLTRLGIGVHCGSGRVPVAFGGAGTMSSASVSVPHWFLLLGLTTPIALSLRRRIARARRIEAGLCEKCGYDLRESPEDQSRYPLNYEARIGAD